MKSELVFHCRSVTLDQGGALIQGGFRGESANFADVGCLGDLYQESVFRLLRLWGVYEAKNPRWYPSVPLVVADYQQRAFSR